MLPLQVGRCKSECRTIARACEMISDDVDLTDLSAMLFKVGGLCRNRGSGRGLHLCRQT